MESFEERIRAIIAEQLKCDMADVVEDAYLVDDLGGDPYDLDELAGALSSEFDIEIGEEEAEQWNTVGDVIQAVYDKTEE